MSDAQPELDEEQLVFDAVVVAAGSSRRMGGIDKLRAELDGRTVLRWSVEALAAAGVRRIAIATTLDKIAEIAGEPWLPDEVVAVVAGGERRQESVAAGVIALIEAAAEAEMDADEADGDDAGVGSGDGAGNGAANVGAAGSRPVAEDTIVLVHDAARPLVSPALVSAVARATAEHGAAIPVLPVTETLKRLNGDVIAETVDRTDVVAAQTPQGVRVSLLRRAYATYHPNAAETWTDEASLLEACRISVQAISGEATNIKVTVPVDLQRAQAMLDAGLVSGRPGTSAISAATRVGFGTDAHPFGPGEPLVLGGVTIDGAPRLSGHSDGDVALHAVADALLGAAGLGDLGRHFPADSRTPKGVDSRELLRSIAAKVADAGYRVVHVDLTIVAARPKLAGLLPSMGEAIAAILGLEANSVNVKASSGNLGGSEGAGRSISASAVATIVPATRAAGEASE